MSYSRKHPQKRPSSTSRRNPGSGKNQTQARTRARTGPPKKPANTANRKPVRKSAKKKPRKNRSLGKALLTFLAAIALALITGVINLGAFLGRSFRSLEPRAKMAAGAGLVILLAMFSFLIVILITSRPNAFQINLDDGFIGIVEMRRHQSLDAEAVENLVIARLMAETGEPVQVFNIIDLLPIRSRSHRPLEGVIEEIASIANFRVQAAIITIDGEPRAIVRNENEASRLLNEILNDSLRDDFGTVIHNGFNEHVVIALEYRDRSAILPFNQAKIVLTQPEPVPYVHTVRTGDNLTRIRERYRMSEASILELNPDIRRDSILRIGQQLNVIRPRPLLTVRTVTEVITTEVARFITIYHETNTQPLGHRSTLAHGEDGSRAVTEHLIYENGTLVSRSQVSYEYIIEPRPEEILVGTGR